MQAGRKARLGTARLGKARQGTARHGKAGHGKARQGWARQGKAGLGTARQGKAMLRHGKRQAEPAQFVCGALILLGGTKHEWNRAGGERSAHAGVRGGVCEIMCGWGVCLHVPRGCE